MRHIIAFIISASMACHAMAIDGITKLRIMESSPTSVLSREGDDEEQQAPYCPLLLQLDSEDTADSLRALGVIIYNHRHDIYLTSVPYEVVDSVLVADGVINAASTCDINSMMDVARVCVSADKIHESADPNISKYDGTGVVVGFSDIGFDASHIAFDGKVKGIHHYDTTHGVSTHAIDDDDIAAYTTDNVDKYHATHVGNILTGHYMGNEYYSVATASQLIATTSDMYDSGILAGVEDIIAYAKACQSPVVINLSLGTSLGPHDGTDLMSQYLSYCAEDAIICVSAGNKGHSKVYAGQNLKEAEAAVSVIGNQSKGSMEIRGYTDIWGDIAHPYEICIGVYDLDVKETVYQGPWVSDFEDYEISSGSDLEFARYFTGSVKAAAELSPLNGRYNVGLKFDVESEATSDRGSYTKNLIYLGVRQPTDFTGVINVDIYADATEIVFGDVASSASIPSADGSISNMACADGVISVGMMTSRAQAPCLTGEDLQWSLPVNNATKYSSYNISPRVKRLPHISAPGYMVVSAISGYYMQQHTDWAVSDMTTVDGRDYYWYADGGTSMSSPLVASIFATWLQADPSLTSERILEIARKTAKRDFEDIDDPRWGAGCIDAFAGLKEVIRQAGIIDATMPHTITVSADGYLNLEGVDPQLVSVYTLSGIELCPTRQLTPGVYIVRYGGQPAQKIYVR